MVHDMVTFLHVICTLLNNFMTFVVKIELLAIHFMKWTSQSSEKTLSGFVLPLI